jgi:trans-aconitate 2-methyltransferase
MLKIARSSSVRAEWMQEDILKWNPADPYDLVFSNAALQWIPNHGTEIVRLFKSVADGGAFAFQISTHTELWYEVLQKLLKSPVWKDRFPDAKPDFYAHELDFYYDLLSPHSRQVDLWETEYVHVLPGPESVVEWNKGTSLRPVLSRLGDANLQKTFLADYTKDIVRAYPRHDNGTVLFPFLRRFVIAYR